MNGLNFTKNTTISGATLYTMHIPHSQTVATGVVVSAGTRDEQWPKEAGIAHALEHMHFQGTEQFPTSEAVSEYLEEIGGLINAWTWKEMTFYHNQVPSAHKERAVKILSQQLLYSIFPEEKIPSEMKNIVQEIRRRNDSPHQYVSFLADQLLYGQHPLGKDTLGIEESVLGFTKKDFIDFKERYYHSSNFTFLAAGDITEQEAQQLFETYFPTRSSKEKNKRDFINLVTPPQKELVQSRKDIEQAHIFLVAPLSEAKHTDSKIIDLFTTMISGGMSFPLFQEVRDKRGLCYEVWASSTNWHDAGEFNLYIGTNPNRIKEAVQASIDVIQEHKKNSLLLEKAKNLELGRLALKYESTDNIINIAAQDIALNGEPKGYEQLVEETKKIKIEDITKAVDTYLSPEHIKTALLVPEKK